VRQGIREITATAKSLVRTTIGESEDSFEEKKTLVLNRTLVLRKRSRAGSSATLNLAA